MVFPVSHARTLSSIAVWFRAVPQHTFATGHGPPANLEFLDIDTFLHAPLHAKNITYMKYQVLTLHDISCIINYTTYAVDYVDKGARKK